MSKRHHSGLMMAGKRNKIKAHGGSKGKTGSTFGFVGSGSRNERMAEHSGAGTMVREGFKRLPKGAGRKQMKVSKTSRHKLMSRGRKPHRGHGYRK